MIGAGVEAIGWGLGVIGLLTCLMSPAAAQANRGNAPASIMIVSGPDSLRAEEEIVREIDDSATGDRWLLERDPRHPGGPGRMVLVGHEKTVRGSLETGNEAWDNGSDRAPALQAPIIRAGDRVTLEEHLALVDASLEAIALGPARQGSELRVRLSIGGRVVRALAFAAGRATLVPDAGVRP